MENAMERCRKVVGQGASIKRGVDAQINVFAGAALDAIRL